MIHGAGSMPASLSRAIVDQTAHPFVVVTSDGTISYAGGSIHDLTGWLPEDLVGRNMIEFVAPAERDRALHTFSELQAAAEGTVSLPIVFEVLTPTGGSIWCEVGALRASDLETDEPLDGMVVRLRPWSHNHHFNLFLEALLSSQPFPEVARALCRSISLALLADGALLHHGFDGSRFLGTDGTGVPLACAPTDEGPWHRAAVEGSRSTQRSPTCRRAPGSRRRPPGSRPSGAHRSRTSTGCPGPCCRSGARNRAHRCWEQWPV